MQLRDPAKMRRIKLKHLICLFRYHWPRPISSTMNQRVSFQNLKLNARGFSLVELMMTVGILGILSLGSASIMTQAFQSHQKAQSNANVQDTVRLFGEMLQKKTIDNGTAPLVCANILKFDPTINTQFDQFGNGKTDVTLTPPGSAVIAKNSVVRGGGQFTVQRLYLDEAVLADDLGTQKLYVASLYVATKNSASGVDFFNRPRQIATMTLTVDSASKAMVSCNVEPLIDHKTVCDGIEGMKWNLNTQKCDQEMSSDPVVFRTDCMPGFVRKASGACKPIQSTCASGQLAKGYNFSQVTACAAPPPGAPVVAVALNPIAVVGENSPTPAPVPPPTAVYVPPVSAAAVGTIPPASTAAVPAPTCANGTALGEVTYDYCFPSPGSPGLTGVAATNAFCQPRPSSAPTKADSTCIERAPTAYTSPPATTSPTPSPSAPNDGTCQCASRRINNNEYCMFCVKDVNFGYGNLDYASGVSRCQSGNLVPVKGGQVDTSVSAPNCNNNYGRARRNANGFYQQYNEPL